MDKELFEELEANLIQALELVRSAQTKQNCPQEQISKDKVLSRSFVVRSRQSVDPDELDEQRQDSTHYPGCMYFRWNWKYSWHESDCTCAEQGRDTP